MVVLLESSISTEELELCQSFTIWQSDGCQENTTCHSANCKVWWRSNGLGLFFMIYLFILLLCTALFLFLLCTFFHCKTTIPVFYLLYCIYLATMAFFAFASLLTSFAHIVLLTVCLFYSMCNSVSSYLSNCFALSWPGRNCK